MKKILVSDYDDTFYLNNVDIEENKKWVDNFRKKGNLFIIATGRGYIDFKEALTTYNFNYDYIILNHGTTIIDKNKNILMNYSIEQDIILKMITALKPKNRILYFYDDLTESTEYIENKKVLKINLRYDSKDMALETAEMLNNKYGEYVKAYPVPINDVEIISSVTNKAKAIYFIANKEQTANDNIYTIGNGHNDIEMIKEFKGYCMTKSASDLKKEATCEFASVSELIKKIIH